MSQGPAICPVCLGTADEIVKYASRDMNRIMCPRCGVYAMTRPAIDFVRSGKLRDSWRTIAGQLRRLSNRESPVELTASRLASLVEAAPVPTNPVDLQDRVLDYIGRRARPFTATVPVPADLSLDYFLADPRELRRLRIQ